MKLKLPRLTPNSFKVALISAVAFGFAGYAVAQLPSAPLVNSINPGDTFLDIVNGYASPTTQYASANQMRSWVFGQNSQHLTNPTLTESGAVCGGNTAAVNGTDVSGQIAMGTSASTNCTVTFATNFASPPEAFVNIDNATDSSLKVHTTNSTMVITQTSASNNLINYQVIGLKGG